MIRFVLLHPGGPAPREELEAIRREPGVTIVDGETERAVLVEANDESIASLRERLPGWVIREEIHHPLPERPHGKRPRKRSE